VTSTDKPRVVQTERRVLQALCQGTPQGSIRETAERLLDKYRWQEPLHRVIFEALMSIPTSAPDLIRDQLPSRLTRKGFPDVPWDDLFEPHALSRQEAERLVHQLATD